MDKIEENDSENSVDSDIEDEDVELVKEGKLLLEKLNQVKPAEKLNAENKHIGYNPDDFQSSIK